MNVYRFRNCLLNTAERAVIKENEHVELTTRTFDLLQYLIENAGNVVTKDDILGSVWNGNFVEESNLPVHISKIRKSLGETRSDRFLETVQGVGYRFVAPVSHVEEKEWNNTLKNCQTRESGLTEFTNNCIAVLPFHNETGDSEVDYLVDGFTEGVINGLSHIPGLRVIARNAVFRYKDREFDIKEVGELLGASRMVTGRMRVIGERFSLGIELIDPRDVIQLWGDQYERPFADIARTQQEIVAVVSARLATASTLGISAIVPTENAESYKSYLKGTYFLLKRMEPDIRRAVKCFRKSVAYCPTNAHAYAEIIDAYILLYVLDQISRSEALAEIRPVLTALSRLNQSLDVVQCVYAKLKINLDWNVREAEAHIKSALALNPNSIRSHRVYSDVMIINGERERAAYHAKQMLLLDPISLLSIKRVGATYYKLWNFEDSISLLDEAYEMEPRDFETLLLLGAAFAEIGDYETALSRLHESYEVQPTVETLSMIGYVEALCGRRGNALAVAQRITVELKHHSDIAVNLARIHAALGEKDAAYAFLEEAFRQHSVSLYGLEYDPRWRKISPESRFKDLVFRVKQKAPSILC